MQTNIRKFLIAAILIVSAFQSCQKEINIETGDIIGNDSTSNTAKYSFTSSLDSCQGATLEGTFIAGTAATSSNRITLKVDVDSIGTYKINTAAVNGISFIASGTFTVAGQQSIILTATGTPINPGSFNYKAGNNGCIFSVIVQQQNTPPPTFDCKECSYMPVCVGSWYIYEMDFAGTNSTLKSSYLSVKDTVVNGAPYHKIETSSDNSGSVTSNSIYYNCTNGVSTAFAYSLTGILGSTVSFIKQTPLKANEAVGAKWSEQIINQIGQTVTNNYEMKEKGISREVLGKTYSNVIHVELTQTIDVGGTQFDGGVTQYYYAKGIGVIEFSNDFNGMINTQYIKDYYIP